jgi:hypothetical protein
MQERAALLGDKYANHPCRWRLPTRNGPLIDENNDRPVELSEIDMAIQVRSGFSTEECIKSQFQHFSKLARDLYTSTSGLEGSNSFVAELARRFILEHNILHDEIADLRGSASLDEETPLSFDWLNQAFSDREGARSDRPLIEIFILYIATLGKFFGFEVVGVEDMVRLGPDQGGQDENRTHPAHLRRLITLVFAMASVSQ